ncbi:hypothetical protein L7F22_011227 [Adiantum nelumboides]|nr:hypothetical protein [Adiantum nelumboides]
MTIVHFLCALAAHFGWDVHQSDIVTAFLNGDIFEEVYVTQPRNFVNKGQEDKVCKCNKSLYGLKQSPRAWYEKVDTHLFKRGFCISPTKSTLYVKREGDVLLIVVFYVDDLLITGQNEGYIAKFKADLNATFKMKDLGFLHQYLDWSNCFDTRVSTSSFCFMLGNSCISWLSKKQPTVGTSSCEAEYRAIFIATIECVWLRCLMANLDVGQDTTNTIYTDSQSALAVARNPIFHACTKHIEVHYHYVKKRLSIGEISLAYVPTQDNLADYFPKALSCVKLEAFRKTLGLLPLWIDHVLKAWHFPLLMCQLSFTASLHEAFVTIYMW